MLIPQLTKADEVLDDFLIPVGMIDSSQKPVTITVGQLLKCVPRGVLRFDEIRSSVITFVSSGTPPEPYKIVYSTTAKRFYAVFDASSQEGGVISTYYSDWPSASFYRSEANTLIDDRLYIDAKGIPYTVVSGELKPASDETIQNAIVALSPVRCDDEADMQAKAATAKVGQQFYIPEND